MDMAKTKKEQPKKYDDKVAVKGTFLEVFKVVKKDKEKRLKEAKKKP